MWRREIFLPLPGNEMFLLNSWCKVQIINIGMLQLSLSTCNIFPLRSKYSCLKLQSVSSKSNSPRFKQHKVKSKNFFLFRPTL